MRITLNNKLVDDNFFFYFWTNNIKVPLIKSHDNSVLKHLPGVKAIREFEFNLPALNIQKKIANILSSLEKKIELNNRINQQLENMAKTLYDYWFVQFDFPDSNGNPYKSSGGKMVYREELKREIPAGWGVDKIVNLIEVKDGTHDSPKKSNKGHYLITSKHLKKSGLDFQKSYLISDEDFILVNKRSKVDNGDLLVSMIGTVGLTYWVRDMETSFAIKNIGLFKTSQKPEIADYLYLSISSSFGIAYIKSRVSTGTSQPYLNSTHQCNKT